VRTGEGWEREKTRSEEHFFRPAAEAERKKKRMRKINRQKGGTGGGYPLKNLGAVKGREKGKSAKPERGGQGVEDGRAMKRFNFSKTVKRGRGGRRKRNGRLRPMSRVRSEEPPCLKTNRRETMRDTDTTHPLRQSSQANHCTSLWVWVDRKKEVGGNGKKTSP